MKPLTLLSLFIFGLSISGCAREACYVDKEYGLASNSAFDQQIVNKDYKYAGKDVSGMDALSSENIMGKYVDTYKESFTKEEIDISTFDVGTK